MNAILAALVNGAIVGAALTAALWLGLLAVPRRTLNAATRYAAWWAALAIAVLLPVWYLPHRMTTTPAQNGIPAPTRPGRARPGQSGNPVRPPPAARSPRLRFPLAIPAGPWPLRIVLAWMVVTAVMLLRLAISCLMLRLRKARARDVPPHLAARVEAWLAQCGSRFPHVRLAASPGIPTPMAAGLGRPTILIPAEAFGGTDGRRARPDRSARSGPPGSP